MGSRLFVFGLRYGLLAKQFFGPARVILRLLELGLASFPIMFGGIDFLFAGACLKFG